MIKKEKLLLLVSAFLLYGCNINTNTSSSTNSSISTSVEVSESSQTSSINTISSEIDQTNKEEYKNKVDRSKITYSEALKNDSKHDVTKLEIYEINDTHGAYHDDSNTTGISRVKTVIENTTNDPYAVVKIANGDLMQGSAFSNLLMGEPSVAALNEMNFDCFVIGNHEFDWGFDYLACYKDGNLANGELNCPFLGANIVDQYGNSPSFVKPYTIVEKGDVKVGIIGVIGDGEESSISAIALNGYHFSSTTEAIAKYAKELEDKVDVTIVATHAHEESYNQAYVNNSNIDAIINAHDHYEIEETVKRKDGKIIPVIESRTKNGSVGKITLNLDDNNKYNGTYKMQHYTPSSYNVNNKLENIMNVYYEAIQEYQNKVIGYTSTNLSKQKIATMTCNYIAQKYQADLVFVNTGGVRATINAGDITVGEVYEVFPFENELYATIMTGNQINKMIDSDSTSYYYYNDNNNIGKGKTYSVEKDKSYSVITVDFLVVSKDYIGKYFMAQDYYPLADYMRDCAIEYFENK